MMYNEFKAIAETCTTLEQLKNALDTAGVRSVLVNADNEIWTGREVTYGIVSYFERWTATEDNGKITTCFIG